MGKRYNTLGYEARWDKDPLGKAEVVRMLPKVGDRLLRRPSWLKWDMNEAPLRRCVVIDVNERHRWYLVRYDQDGLVECFHVPDTKGKEGDNEAVDE